MNNAPNQNANTAVQRHVDTSEHQYTMTIALSVLEHLGVGLYSNVPAVVSELVANAWDADADEVVIDIDPGRRIIRIKDDGIGMDRDAVNSKFLTVGYQKRKHEPPMTAKGRSPMGRKGIGKLSVFAIADTVEVYSAQNGDLLGLRMTLPEIQETIANAKDESRPYHPTPIDDLGDVDLNQGTLILLKDVKKDLSATAAFLRRRLARRFSVIGGREGFSVSICDQPITVADRDFLRKLEFVWVFGEESRFQVEGLLADTSVIEVLPNEVAGDQGYRVSGWIGTVAKRQDIGDDQSNNNAITIMARGKLVHEDILTSLGEGGVYSKYVIGEVHADFIDSDELQDAVTSSRQTLNEDDPRFSAIKDVVRRSLKTIESRWRDLRRTRATDRALAIPAVREWFGELEGDDKKAAMNLFGKIESLGIDTDSAKNELYRSSILAFERLKLRHALGRLEEIDGQEQFEAMTKLFGQVDEIEAVEYHNIAKGRIGIIKEFEDILPDARERVLQQHIFDHLWLLDPSWERATKNRRIEQSVTREFDAVNAKLTDDERAGRIDIRYRTAAGKHIIIELKKYDVKTDVMSLITQTSKYKSALRKCLTTNFPEDPQDIEVICIVGVSPLSDDPQTRTEDMATLASRRTRILTYDTLIQDAQYMYADYIEADQRVSRLVALLDRVDRELSLSDNGESKATDLA